MLYYYIMLFDIKYFWIFLDIFGYFITINIIKIYKLYLLVMLINLIIVIFYLIFYLNFFCMIIFIPIGLLYLTNPIGSKKYFSFIKNILTKSIGFVVKIFLFPNVFIDSNTKLIEFIENLNKNKILLISNHITELDFLLIPLFTINSNLTNTNVQIAKKDVGYQIPFIGLTGSLSGDIFLQRNVNLDIDKLNKKIDFNFMMLYPEGTCFTKQKKIMSDNYCDKNKLIKFKYHLYPRLTGLELIINNNKDIKFIYDFTVIYDSIKKNYGPKYALLNFLLCKFKIPNKIFIKINKYKIDKKIGFDKKIIENIYLSKDDFIEKFDINCNNFVPVNYNYLRGFKCFISVNLICVFSIYLCVKFNFIKFLYLFQILIYYIYFYFCI